MAARLSQKSVVGDVGSGKSSKVSQWSQMASLAACVAAMYSASSSCLREYQETAPPSIRKA